MPSTAFLTRSCLLLVCVCATTPLTPAQQPTAAGAPTPLILEKNEGEARVLRGWPGHPDPGELFTLKVDPKNGGSTHLVFITGSLAPGGEIVAHRHPGADEILFLETGIARVHLADSVGEVHAGATIFISAGTWISLTNIGKDTINMEAIFSSPGFEDYMREVSVPQGEKSTPLTPAEDAAIAKNHTHAVIYKDP
jgi:quercetin dioxygenase-like cupin family protein